MVLEEIKNTSLYKKCTNEEYELIYHGLNGGVRQGILFDSSYIECLISGVVGPYMISTFLNMLSEIESNKYNGLVENIVIRFSSPGGSVYDCLTILDLIDVYNCDPLNTSKICMFGTGFIGSAGLLVFVSGDKRNCSNNSKFMYHQISSSVNYSPLRELESYTGFLTKLEDDCDNYLMKKTKLKKKDLEQFKKKDVYFDAETALKYGIVHEVLHIDKKG